MTHSNLFTRMVDGCAREFRAIVKDEGMVIFLFIVPLLYPLVYAWIYHQQVVREVPVAVVDMSHSPASRQLIRAYDATPDVAVTLHANSLAEARSLMGQQQIRGVLYIPSDFESLLAHGQQATVSLYCDMSVMLYYKAIYQAATATVFAQNEQLQVQVAGGTTERDDELTVHPLSVEEVPIFNPSGGYADFLIPGVLVLILHQVLLLAIGLRAGTLRENASPAAPPSTLGAALCFFLVGTAMGAYVLTAVPRLFGLLQMERLLPLVALLLPFLAATIAFGLLLSVLVRHRENVMLLVVFTSVPLLMLSGITWPQTAIPAAWQGVACLFPSTFGIRAFIRLNSMGATLADVRPELLALCAQTVVYGTVTAMANRWRKKLTKSKKVLQKFFAK